jgi:hypothetical protein
MLRMVPLPRSAEEEPERPGFLQFLPCEAGEVVASMASRRGSRDYRN